MFDDLMRALMDFAIVTRLHNLRIVHERTISAIARLRWIEQNAPLTLSATNKPDMRLSRGVTELRLEAESFEFSFTYSYATIPNVREIIGYADAVSNAYQAAIDEYSAKNDDAELEGCI